MPSRLSGVYSTIQDDCDNIGLPETNEGYTELQLMQTDEQNIENTPAAPPEPPPPRPHKYLELIDVPIWC